MRIINNALKQAIYVLSVFVSIGVGMNVPRWLYLAETRAPSFNLLGFSDDEHTAAREPLDDIIARAEKRLKA